MQPNVAKYLQDVQKACTRLQRITAGKSLVDYQADEVLQWAVERQFIIIGEALAQAGKIDASLQASITSFGQILGFRNILVHGYANIQTATVWGVVENDLLVLQKEVEALLAGPASP